MTSASSLSTRGCIPLGLVQDQSTLALFCVEAQMKIKDMYIHINNTHKPVSDNLVWFFSRLQYPLQPSFFFQMKLDRMKSIQKLMLACPELM